MTNFRSHTLATAFILLILAPIALASSLPQINGDEWINTLPLKESDFEGKVVLVKFWTYGCSNCRAVEPYVKIWHEHYANQGLLVIGVHTPEFAYERQLDNVIKYIKDHQITYPVVTDNEFSTWRRFSNRYWPTIYLFDRHGELRYRKIGEGGYDQTEAWLKKLLAETSPQ